MVPCAASGCLSVVRDEDGSIRYSKCLICEGSQEPGSLSRDEEACQRVSQDSILILINLVQSEAFIHSRRPRVLGMVALQRFTIHFKNFDFMDLDTSLLGQWCLACLQSSIRELRILAG
jgi:serine/threonine-protein kinase ATR